MVGVLVAEPTLTRHLTEHNDDSDAKVRLTDRLFSNKVDEHTLKLLRTAVSQRWSAAADFVDGIEHLARLALLKRAELENQVDEVEEQLFRFGRVLDSEPRLTALLSDYTTPLDGRIALLDKVVGGSASTVRPRLCSSRPSASCAANVPTKPWWTWPSWPWPAVAKSSPTSTRPPS